MRFKRLNHLFITALLGATVPCELPAMDINTGYVVSNQASLGITRVFDDHENTVIEFVDIGAEKPAFFDTRGHRIHMARVGDYAVLSGLQTEVHVKEGAAEAVVKVATIQRPAPTSTIQGSPETPSNLHPLPALPRRPPGDYTAIPIHDVALIGQSAAHTATYPVGNLQPVVQVTPAWTLKKGTPIGTQLKGWAVAAHWTLIWCNPSDYLAPAQYSPPYSDFIGALKDVIETLSSNGARIHFHIYSGNSTVVVFGDSQATCGVSSK